MARMEPGDVLKRAEHAWKENDLWRDQHRDAYDLALPSRNLLRGDQPGARKQDRVFDSTLQHSTIRFANRLQTELCPPFQKWATMVPGPFVPEQAKEQVRAQLNSFRDALFAAIHISNFDTAVNEFFLDLSIGTGVMGIFEGDDTRPVRFQVVPQVQVALEEGPWGEVDGVYRRHSMKARLVKRTWKDAKLPEGWDKMLKDDPERDVELEEATYYDAEDDVWYYDVVTKMSSGRRGKGEATRLVERKYEDSPWVVTRWVKIPGETKGRGPVLVALPDAKTLNKVKELILKNASIAIAGVWTAVDDGVLNPNTVRIVPGAVIPVARNDGMMGPSLKALETGGRFDVSQIVVEDLTQNVKKIMMDNQLPPDAGPVRSATEIVQRIKELQQDIGSPFGRLMTEFIQPLLQKVMNILTRRGIINIPGGKTVKINGATVAVQVTSPLAQVQNLNDVQTAVQWMSMVQSLGPEAFMLGVKVEDVPKWLSEKMGVDPKLARPDAERSNLQGMAGQMLGMRMGAGGDPSNVIPIGRGRQSPASGAASMPMAA